MSIPPPHRPLGIRALNGFGRALGAIRLDWPSLDPDDLLATAMRRAGSDDFGGDEFRAGMSVLLAALEEEAELTTLGRLSCRETLVGYLENRLRLQQYRSEHPELERTEIRRPVFIVGLPRTGTTILFNLIAQDLRNRPPLSWEVQWPVPPPEPETYDRDPRIADAVKLFGNLDRVLPALPSIHEFGATLPQECVPIRAHEFLSVQFQTTFNVPSYQAWLERQDLGPAYNFHKRFLQHLQSRYMKDRWVLKSPAHLGAIDEILATYPDAHIIHTHRDPAKVMPSLASLMYTLRSMNSDALDPARIGRQVLDMWTLSLERATDARRRHRDKPNQFFDAYFEDTLSDPVDLLRRAYEHFELPWTPATRDRMAAFLADNPRGSRGVHKYVRQDFEIDLDEIRSRFSEYCREFDVPLST
ncbi:MAG: sulfotransferase [Myxococcota bacterium]